MAIGEELSMADSKKDYINENEIEIDSNSSKEGAANKIEKAVQDIDKVADGAKRASEEIKDVASASKDAVSKAAGEAGEEISKIEDGAAKAEKAVNEEAKDSSAGFSDIFEETLNGSRSSSKEGSMSNARAMEEKAYTQGKQGFLGFFKKKDKDADKVDKASAKKKEDKKSSDSLKDSKKVEAEIEDEEDIDPSAGPVEREFLEKQKAKKKKKENRKEKNKNFLKNYWWVILAAICVLVIICAIVSAVKESKKKRVIGLSSLEVVGANYDDIVGRLQENGFTNINGHALEDLDYADVEEEHKVDQIEVNGVYSFEADKKFKYDTEINITYHSLKEITAPLTSKKAKGMQHSSVASAFKEAGFVNVTEVIKYDLITGWITKDGSVASVSISGNTKYKANAKFRPDVEVVITYHTFKKNKP
jgi:hypothetical protein